MKLTIHTNGTTQQIELSPSDYFHLRSGADTSALITHIAAETGIEPSVLARYAAEIIQSTEEADECDGACDYTDHL